MPHLFFHFFFDMTYVPVLGKEGWVKDGKKKLDILMAHLYASDASQSHFFFGEVASMVKVVKENQGRLQLARESVQAMLENYFSKYYNTVGVNVYINESNDTLRGELVLSAELIDEDGIAYQLHEVMTNKGSLTRKFLNYQENDPS